MKQCSRLKTRIGQYNVRTIYQKARFAQLNRIIGEYERAVLGVSKVRCNDNGRTETTNGDVFSILGNALRR